MDKYAFRKPQTLLQYPLNKKQHVYGYYLIPVCFSCVVYVLQFATDLVLSYQHYRRGDVFHGGLTLFWMFVPSIASFFLIVINVDLWPEEEKCGSVSVKWFFIRFLQHLFFPVWAMFRFAELLFWRIEALRSVDETERDELLSKSTRRSAFSLYHFFQAYFQAIPQILLQIRIIMKHPSDFDKQTVDMQVMCIIMSLIKLSMTTTAYQRFQSQKIAGREYPWDKIKEKQRIKSRTTKINPPERKEDSRPESQITRRDSGLSNTSSQFEEQNQMVLPMRIDSVKGLPDDDAAGKFVSMLWWFCFLLPRVVTISIFAHFYPREAVLGCFIHYSIILILLFKYGNFKNEMPESEIDGLTRRRKIYKINCTSEGVQQFSFYLILSYIYVFCLIEFKIQFTKVLKLYNCYFIIVYLENFVMMFFWHSFIERFDNWWFDYAFYLVVGSSILSVLSMAMYLSTLKPKKMVVNQTYRHSQL